MEPKRSGKHVNRFISRLRQNLPELRDRYGVRSLGIFGSYVRGEQRKRSDLDILVDFNNGTLTLFQFVELRDFLSDLLGVKVDLVEKRALKPVIGKHIFEEVVSV
jgi:predicted nucleotidyltransferase